MIAWGFFGLGGRKACGGETVIDIEGVAGAICRNLRGLGLQVQRRNYGKGFCEIAASTSPKIITTPDGREASGIAILLAGAYEPPTLVFEEINSLKPGLGSRMVGAVIAGLQSHPGVFERLRVNDLSPRLNDGRRWWEHIASAHSQFQWLITHDEDVTHMETKA